MPLLQRKRVVLAKIESSYGVDPTPTGSANAILCSSLNFTPQDSDFAGRDLVRPYLGRGEQIPAAIRGMLEIEVELAGVSVAGTAAAYGPLLRACGMAEQLLAAAVTGTAQAGAASSITLAAGASAVDNFYLGMPVRTTGGTGSGQTAFISAYNGTTKVATIIGTWTTNPDNTTTYSIDAQAIYRPISQTFESVTLYFNVDGVLHKLLGARGTFQLSAKVKEIPKLKFSLTGLYSTPTDTALPTPTYTQQTPIAFNNINTSLFKLHNYAGVLSDLELNLSGQIVHRTLVGGAEQVLFTDREPQGTLTIEADTVANKDWWTIAKNATLGGLQVSHGISAGNRVRLASSQVQLTAPNYQDMDGVAMLQFGINCIPSSVGNDDFWLSVG